MEDIMTAPTKICVPVTTEFLPVLVGRLESSVSDFDYRPMPLDMREFEEVLYFSYDEHCGPYCFADHTGFAGYTLTTPNQFVETVAAIWPKE
jgi:hypothetical protein